MRRIVLDMRSGMFADAVAQSLSDSDPDFSVCRSSRPEETSSLCKACQANVLVMEVVRQSIWTLKERLKIREELRKALPDCKVLLLVDENAEEQQAAGVRQAVKDKLVDGFIYTSVSPTYLAAVIDTL